MRRRPRLAVAAAVLVLTGVGGAGMHVPFASADSQTSPPGRQVAGLDARLRTLTTRISAVHARVDRTALALGDAGDRVARLSGQLSWYLQADRSMAFGPAWLRPHDLIRSSLQAALGHAERDLARVELVVRRQRLLPTLFALEDERTRLTAERRAKLASIAVVAPAQTVAPAQSAAVTRESWATTLLTALDAPTCSNNLVALVTWQTAENTAAAWNPLATTMPAPGATDFNSMGVRNFATEQDGVQATIATLRAGYRVDGYGWILYRLGQCAPPLVTAKAINASNWCWGCAGGGYVVGMLPAVESDYATFAAL